MLLHRAHLDTNRPPERRSLHEPRSRAARRGCCHRRIMGVQACPSARRRRGRSGHTFRVMPTTLSSREAFCLSGEHGADARGLQGPTAEPAVAQRPEPWASRFANARSAAAVGMSALPSTTSAGSAAGCSIRLSAMIGASKCGPARLSACSQTSRSRVPRVRATLGRSGPRLAVGGCRAAERDPCCA